MKYYLLDPAGRVAQSLAKSMDWDKVGIICAPIINRINYLSENVLCSKNDKIVTDILEKPGSKKH